MKILIAAVSHSAHISGVQRHALNMVRCLLLNKSITRIHIVFGPWQSQIVTDSSFARDARVSVHFPEIRQHSVARNFWHYNGLPKLVAQLQPDLVHLSYPVPLNASAIQCPTVLTLHDLYPYEIPENFGFHQRLFNRMILRRCLKGVDAIVCVSDATMTNLAQYATSEVVRKAIRIYNCVEREPIFSSRSSLPGWKGEPFLLSVAQHRRNKNIPLLLVTFRHLLQSDNIDPATRLVIVGIKGPETELIGDLIHRYGLSFHVLLLEGISQAGLQWCYMQSSAVVLPSVTEGFGLPLAEALLVGCRIVCSDIPVFREIGGNDCTFFALGANEQNNLAIAIRVALDLPPKHPVSLPFLSAPELASQYSKFYRSLIASTVHDEDIIYSPTDPLADTERQSI